MGGNVTITATKEGKGRGKRTDVLFRGETPGWTGPGVITFVSLLCYSLKAYTFLETIWILEFLLTMLLTGAFCK